MKIIVIHFNPDEDAIMAVWLVRRFLPGWSKARVEFVSAGETFEGKPVDDDPEILHCDTGGGKFDHHQTGEFLCSATLIWRQILKENQKINDFQKKAIERMLEVVTENDHARFLAWPEPTADRYDFSFYQSLGGLVAIYKNEPAKLLEYSLAFLEAIFLIFQQKVEGEGVLENSLRFKTRWGQGAGIKANNSKMAILGLRSGYAIVVSQRPKTGQLGIYGNWQNGVNLKKLFAILKRKDPEASWFLHASGCILLNGTASNPNMKPTKLELEEVVKIVEKL